MKKNTLTAEDKETIKRFNAAFEQILITIERAKQFKLGDFLVLYLTNWDGKPEVQKNTYGAPVKYKVVHCTESGVAFIKKTSKNGTPIGELYSCCGTEYDKYRRIDQNFRFELDPDYADSLLLEDEDYDPATLHKSKQDIWKAVTAHNKAAKVGTSEARLCYDFFASLNVGDIFWTSTTGFFLVQDKKAVPAKDFNAAAKWQYMTSQKFGNVTILTLKDKKGKVFDCAGDYFRYKALYREKPRSYKELNI